MKKEPWAVHLFVGLGTVPHTAKEFPEKTQYLSVSVLKTIDLVKAIETNFPPTHRPTKCDFSFSVSQFLTYYFQLVTYNFGVIRYSNIFKLSKNYLHYFSSVSPDP